MIGDWQDISVTLNGDLPTWPDSPGVVTTPRLSIDNGDSANVTQLNMDVHTGTHVDAPRHFIPDGATLDEIGVEPFIGPATVIDTGEAREISATLLEEASISNDVERLLLRTVNSSRSTVYRTPFDEDYAALTHDGAEWIASRQIRLVGIDYLSIERYTESPKVHLTLLGAGIPIVEGLFLADVTPGEYDLVCLPINLVNVEGAPARAILLPRDR